MTVYISGAATDTSVINVLYTNVLASGTLSWSTQATGYNAVNLTYDETWNAWKPTASGFSYVQTDYGSAVMCNAAGVSAHNLASVGATVSIQYSTDGVTYTPVIAAYAPLTNEDLFFFFPNTTARYWRYAVNGPISSTGAVKIGAALKFPCAPLDGHRPLHHSRSYDLMSNQSMGGNLLGNRVVKTGAETTINAGQVDRAWAESDLAVFERVYNEGGAFFYCGAPLDIPKDTGYCWRPNGGKEMSITWVEGDVMADVSFDVRSYVAT